VILKSANEKKKIKKEKRRRKKENYQPFSAAAEGEHIHTLTYI